jgi:hypothetical protein
VSEEMVSHYRASGRLLSATAALVGVGLVLLLVQPRGNVDARLEMQQWAFLLGWLAWSCSLLTVITSVISWRRARRPKWWLGFVLLFFLGLTWLIWFAIPIAMLN